MLLMLLAAIACASLVNVVSGGTPALQPRLTVQPSASDSTSLDVRLRWQASRAQRGATVAHYEGAVLVNGVIAGTFETAALEAVVTIERPVPGDTVSIIGRVRAVDSRGIAGDIATSPPFTYYEPVAGPTAPGPIEIDTLDVGEIGMRYDSLRIVAPHAEVDEDGVLRMVVGDTVTVCGIGFANDRAYVVRNEELEWSSSDPAVVELQMTSGVPAECMPLGAQGSRRFAPFRALAVLTQ